MVAMNVTPKAANNGAASIKQPQPPKMPWAQYAARFVVYDKTARQFICEAIARTDSYAAAQCAYERGAPEACVWGLLLRAMLDVLL